MTVPGRLREHEVTLRDAVVVLRPMRESDWDVLHAWNNDVELQYDVEPVESRTLDEVQGMYRSLSRAAYMFVIEFEGVPVGAAHLQEMNLVRLSEQFPGRDLRRIDIEITPSHWDRGIGTRAVALLLGFAFARETADAVFAVEVADHNPRSRAMFEKLGFELVNEVPQAPPVRATVAFDLMVTRETHEAWSSG